jgi:putative transposase
VLQDVLVRLDNAYNAFLRRLEEGAGDPGFPKFKKRGKWNSITFPQRVKAPDGSKVYVPKIGTVKLVYHRPIPADACIKTMSVVKEAGRWFVCFSAQVPVELEPKQTVLPSVGIDMGLIDFYYTSDGDKVPPPKYFRKKEKQLKRLQQRLSRAKKRTPEYLKILGALKKCHYRIKCRRADFLHKQTNRLLSAYDCIFHEDLSIQNMIKRPEPKPDGNGGYLPNGAKDKSRLNKSISDVGWHKFFSFLKYKAESLNKTVVPVPPAYTSQLCSACGAIVKKSLSTRTHKCECGYIAPRDLNAAINILCVGMHTLQAST